MPQNADRVTLPADSNQALGLANFAIDFMSEEPGKRGEPDKAVLERTEWFHTDASLCGVSAIALGTNAPTVLREEAAQYAVSGSRLPWARQSVRAGVPVFGSTTDVSVEKAIVANCAAVREWDSNGTNFGFSEERAEHRAGEFGHNDFYSVPLAAAQLRGRDGAYALRGMVLHDEIRGRLAEVFSLKTYKIDHVVHGAVASAAVFGAMMGATPEQIESAIGMVIAHAIPFRAIRHGHQLSDSKGASAAISTEFAITAVKRSMMGFIGPKDIFRNPEAIFNLMPLRMGGTGAGSGTLAAEAAAGMKAGRRSPFDLVLSRAGRDFTVMGMHFKLGLYEHQSAGALQGLIDLVGKHRRLLEDQSGDNIARIVVRAYEPAFGIIGDPHKRDPHTRQSADHSMLYLVCTMLRKALELHAAKKDAPLGFKELMLGPYDFDRRAIHDPLTRSLMAKMSFEHGGPEYDRRYPDGIPTSVVITDDEGKAFDSGMVMYPAGHARNTTADLRGVLDHKWTMLAGLVSKDAAGLVSRFTGLEKLPADRLGSVMGFDLAVKGRFE